MSTKFKDFTLEDPCGSIDLSISKDNDGFCLDGTDYKKANNDWPQIKMVFEKSSFSKIKSCFSITIDDKPLGYIRDVDADLLMPFYEIENSNMRFGDALFSVKILRVNHDINGVAGVTIRINIKDVDSITFNNTDKKYTVITK